MSLEIQTRTNEAKITVPQRTLTHINARSVGFEQERTEHVLIDFSRSTY